MTVKQIVPLLDVNRSNEPLKQEFQEVIVDIISSGRFVGGSHCSNLENEVAEYCETDFAIGCASGSDALLLSLMAIDLQPGDEVLVPSFTFFATVSCVTRLGARPVFVDIDPNTFNIDPKLIERLITKKTKAIVPVHLFGQCADMEQILAIARDHGLYVIEDAAQSIGARFDGSRAGSMGQIGCFSFYPTKNLGGFGDGGMITTNDAVLAEKLRLLTNHGMQPRYYHQIVGINSRLDAIQAAILSIKLKHVDRFNAGRSANARSYSQLVQASGLQNQIKLPFEDPRCHHVWNQLTVRIVGGARDQIRESLAERGIGTEVYYPVPMHEQACFRYLGFGSGSLPETEQAAREVLSLPIFPELTEFEINQVVKNLGELVLGRQPYRMAS